MIVVRTEVRIGEQTEKIVKLWRCSEYGDIHISFLVQTFNKISNNRAPSPKNYNLRSVKRALNQTRAHLAVWNKQSVGSATRLLRG